MPSILRIFVYQTDASLSLSGSCQSYDQGGGGEDMKHLQHLCRENLKRSICGTAN